MTLVNIKSINESIKKLIHEGKCSMQVLSIVMKIRKNRQRWTGNIMNDDTEAVRIVMGINDEIKIEVDRIE